MTLLTATLIVGVIIVVAALVIRLARPPAAPGFDPRGVGAARLALPEGETPVAAGGAPGALILITRDAGGIERMRFFDAATGEPTATVLLERR